MKIKVKQKSLSYTIHKANSVESFSLKFRVYWQKEPISECHDITPHPTELPFE